MISREAKEWICPLCEADNYVCACGSDDEIHTLKIALHDAIKSPKGVVPKSAERFYDARRFYDKET